MFKELLKKSWFTTLVGVLLIAGAAGDAVVCTMNGGSLWDCAQSAWTEILAAVGFIGAKDALAGGN